MVKIGSRSISIFYQIYVCDKYFIFSIHIFRLVSSFINIFITSMTIFVKQAVAMVFL